MSVDIAIRGATPADATAWESMRRQLWPDGADDHAPEIAMFFDGQFFKDLCAALMVESRSGELLAFAELSIRDDLPELEGERTGYVEGLYVSPELRHSNVARRFLRASRNWAEEQGCTAFASDRAGRIVVDRSFAASP